MSKVLTAINKIFFAILVSPLVILLIVFYSILAIIAAFYTLTITVVMAIPIFLFCIIAALVALVYYIFRCIK